MAQTCPTFSLFHREVINGIYRINMGDVRFLFPFFL